MAAHPGKDTPVRVSPATGKSVESHADLLEDLRLVWLDVRGLAHDHLALAALEARRAGTSLIGMLAAGVVMAVLLISAWFGLMAAAALALVRNDLAGDIAAILLVGGANLLLAALLFWYVRRKSRDLLFPETVRSFRDWEAP